MKNLVKVIALAVAVMMLMATAAFADAAIGTPAVAEEVVTVNLTGLQAGEEATILAVAKDTELASLNAADIVFIDQKTVNEEGKVEFVFDASAITVDKDGKKYVDVYCGYSSMDVAAPLASKAVLVFEPTAKVVYGDVTGEGSVTIDDATYLLQYLAQNINAFPGGDSAKVAIDVTGDGSITIDDATSLLQYLAQNITKFPVELK